MKAVKGTGASGARELGLGARAQGRAHLERSLAETRRLRLWKTGGLGDCHFSSWDRAGEGSSPGAHAARDWEAESPKTLRFGDLFNADGEKQ